MRPVLLGVAAGLGVVGLAILVSTIFLDRDQSLLDSTLGLTVITATWFCASYTGASVALRWTSRDAIVVVAWVAAGLIASYLGVGISLAGGRVEGLGLGIVGAIVSGSTVAVWFFEPDGEVPGAAD